MQHSDLRLLFWACKQHDKTQELLPRARQSAHAVWSYMCVGFFLVNYIWNQFDFGKMMLDRKREHLKVKQSCNVFFKLTILPINKTKEFGFLPNSPVSEYGPTFGKGGHKERTVYHVRERRFISPWCKQPIHTTYSWNIKWQKCAGMGLNGFIFKKINEN